MESYFIGVKKKSRDVATTFIARTFKNFSKLKVLCFPGKEALEISIYDKLGIPRENITCLEYDRANYLLLKKNPKASGCKVFHQSLEDFVCGNVFKLTPDEGFDICFLDFTGHFVHRINEINLMLVSDVWLKETGVMITNFAGSREQKVSKKYYEWLDNFAKQNPGSECPKTDRRAISVYLRLAVVRTTYGCELAANIQQSALNDSWCSVVGGRLIKKAGLADSMMTLRNATALGAAVATAFVHRFCEREVIKQEAYRYISSSRTPMLMDLISFRSPLIFPSLEPLSVLHGQLSEKINLLSQTQALRICNEIAPLAAKRQLLADPFSNIPKRMPLGRESAHPLRQKKLSKEEQKAEVIRLTREGFKTDQIALKLGMNTRTVAAFRAHVTMGSYE